MWVFETVFSSVQFCAWAWLIVAFCRVLLHFAKSSHSLNDRENNPLKGVGCSPNTFLNSQTNITYIHTFVFVGVSLSAGDALSQLCEQTDHSQLVKQAQNHTIYLGFDAISQIEFCPRGRVFVGCLLCLLTVNNGWLLCWVTACCCRSTLLPCTANTQCCKVQQCTS